MLFIIWIQLITLHYIIFFNKYKISNNIYHKNMFVLKSLYLPVFIRVDVKIIKTYSTAIKNDVHSLKI